MTETGGIVDLRKALTGARVEIMALEGEMSKKPVTGTIEGMMNQLAEVWIRTYGNVVYPVVIVVNLDSPYVDRDRDVDEGVTVRKLFLFVYDVKQLDMLITEGWTNESAIVAYRLRDEDASDPKTLSRDDLHGVAKDVDLRLLHLAER